jgi:hypothetical protein
MIRRAARRDLFGLVIVGAALTTGLHLLGGVDEILIDWSDPIRWLEQASAETAIAASLRTIGLAVGYWLSATAVLYALSTLNGCPSRRGFISWITLPGVRRIVDRALATALTASIVTSPLQPAFAEDPPPPVVFDINTDGVPIPVIRLEPGTGPTAGEPAPLQPITPQPITPEIPVLDTAPPTLSSPSITVTAATITTGSYTVINGDNLWLIAERRVRAVGGDTTAVYWRQLIAANRTTLRSGDPNLIYPGEIISLPTIEATP